MFISYLPLIKKGGERKNRKEELNNMMPCHGKKEIERIDGDEVGKPCIWTKAVITFPVTKTPILPMMASV